MNDNGVGVEVVNPVDELKEAENTLKQAKIKSAELCTKELNDLLEKYKCTLVGYQEVINGIPQAFQFRVIPV
jgi:hypothetical protein